jgi:hypothetical protein
VQLCRQKALQPVQIDRPELAETLHPDRGGAQRVRFQLAPFHATAPFLRDQPGLGQHRKMLGNRGQRHREGVGHIGDGHVIFQKHCKDRAPRRIGKCGKDLIKRVRHGAAMSRRRHIVNHPVEYGRRAAQTRPVAPGAARIRMTAGILLIYQ